MLVEAGRVSPAFVLSVRASYNRGGGDAMDGDRPAQGLSAEEAGLAALRDTVAESVAEQRPLERREVDHRILGLAVHGIGNQKVGGTVEDVVGAIYPLVRTIDPAASVAVKPLDEGDPAEARIWFSHKGERYELRCFEVWWAQAFQAPSFGQFFSGVFACVRAGWRRQRGGPDVEARGALWPLWRDRGWGLAFWQRLLIEAGALLLAPLVLAALIVLWIIDAIIPKFLLGTAIARPINWLINALTGHFGDLIVYMQDPWEASRIRVRFEQRFYQLINLIDPVTDAVFVVAHSLGGVVSFEALTGGRMTETIEDTFSAGVESSERRPSLHFITAGSVLNMAWDLAPVSEQYRFYREPSTKMNWVDLWSQQDPGPRGRIRPPSAIPASRVSSDCVANRMSIVQDHTSYWDNVPEVVARILKEISGSKLDHELQMDVKGHQSRVRVLGALLLGVLIVFPAALAVTWLFDARPFLSSLAFGGIALLIYHSAINWVWSMWDGGRRYSRAKDGEVGEA
jgi:hypothetical protein